MLAQFQAVKTASQQLAALSSQKRQDVLHSLAEQIEKNSAFILQENAKDLALMSNTSPLYDRLQLTEPRIHSIADDIRKMAALPSPLGIVLEETIRPNQLRIQKISVPLGVVAVIYESRPNVTLDVFSLCFKSGNACILKAGKEAQYSNAILVDIILTVLRQHDITTDAVFLMPLERTATETLLNATGFVDVCIPRGSQALIDYVRANAKIPVIETGAGIVHTYFDQTGDVVKGQLIIENAKTRRVSVCNALDTLIIHEARLDDLCELTKALSIKHVEIFADDASYSVLHNQYPAGLLHHATADDFGQEFLSLKMSIKTVASIDAAIAHIRHYSSQHSEAIITEDTQARDYFFNHIDAAVIYVNTSTAFTDGGEFGMGAEIGISTQKLHARGPMGLPALTSYKWLVYGDGQIRS
jgi:glutamate-5-semialdehyde dehydrogenase